MSGELAARRRRNKKNPLPTQSENNGPSTGKLVSTSNHPDKSERETSSGAGCCMKTLTVLILSVCVVIGTVIYVDYQPGQLNDVYVKNVPLEYRLKVREATTAAGGHVESALRSLQERYDRGQRMVRESVKGVRIGEFDVEYALFGEVEDVEQSKAKEEMGRKMAQALKDINELKEAEERKQKEETIKKQNEDALRRMEAERLVVEAQKAKKAAEKAEKAREVEEKRKQEEAAKAKKAAEAAEAAQKAQKAEEDKKRAAVEQARVAAAEAEKAKKDAVAAEKAKQAAETQMKAEAAKALKATEEAAKAKQGQADADKAKKVAEESTRQAKEETEKLRQAKVAEADKLRKEQEAKQAAEAVKASQAASEAANKKNAEQAKKTAEEVKFKREEAHAQKLQDKPLDSAAREKIGERRAEEDKKPSDPRREGLRKDEDRIKAAKKAGIVAKEQQEQERAKKADPQTLAPDYPKIGITSSGDLPYISILDEAEAKIKSEPKLALERFEKILVESGNLSPRALYGKARCLDRLSELKKSNDLLEQSIQAFLEVISLASDIPETLLRLVGHRCVERMQFRGWNAKAIRVLQTLIRYLPNDPSFSNQLGVQYLLIGQTSAAKEVFQAILRVHPNSGIAAVHLGFVLKTTGTPSDLPEAVQFLQSGIQSNEEGTQDGRFWYHLGEGLRRLGREEEATQMYQQAVEKRVFPSFWQRSLYNVDHLRAQPVWSKLETGQTEALTALENNWKIIRNEALLALGKGKDGFEPEGENLKDKGTWGQFELFKQGKIVAENCKKTPKTCAMIRNIPAAASNKRGQVKFSLMRPGTHVHAHTGPTNCRLRAHLGLQVPKSGLLRLRVANDNLTWVEGRIIVFDDSFDHEVWHEADGDRIVLIVDLWHPDLDEQTKAQLSPI